MAKKKKTIRTEFRKNRARRARTDTWTQQFQDHRFEQDDTVRGERISGKGDLTRKRTIVGDAARADEAGFGVQIEVDQACRTGRVLSVHGLTSTVEDDDSGCLYKCATRRLLKTLSTDQRHVVAAGDRVMFRAAGDKEGVIERVEPRRGVLSRNSRGRQHIMVANVDLMLIIGSAAEPYLKPNLIDRFLVTAEKNRIRPLICINKVDLVDRAALQPLVGVYSQMGYAVFLISAKTGFGVERIRGELVSRASVVVGQSGVGKSSILNMIEEGLHLRVGEVSAESQKGKHTTTTARLLALEGGGYVVDTPGIRQFQLWDIIPEEVAGCYRDIRPFVNLCRYPSCTHTHEAECAVKDAVADGRLDARRYESYCQIFEGDVA